MGGSVRLRANSLFRVRVTLRSLSLFGGLVMAMVNGYALFIVLKCVVVILMEIAIMHCSMQYF